MNLLAALVDDAGLFPPEQLAMGPALARHAADERADPPGRLMLTHRFLCPASRLDELRSAPELDNWAGSGPDRRPGAPAGPGNAAGSGGPVEGPGVGGSVGDAGSGGSVGDAGSGGSVGDAGSGGRTDAGTGADRRLRLGLILDTGFDGLEAALAAVGEERRVVLEVVEAPVPEATAIGPALDALGAVDVAAFLEGPLDPGWLKTVAARYPANSGGPLRGAKVRCGGARVDLFPSPDELAAFLCACFEHGVPFKASAGLHSAVRHRDERTGFVHHGFLNLLLASVAAAMGSPAGDVAKVLAATDGPALAAEAQAVSGRALSAARLLFRSYGSCSTSEPREEAAALGLLAEPHP